MKTFERIDVEAIHRAVGPEGWHRVLEAVGIESRYLRNKHGPCPICGEGKDRFRYDNKHGRGGWFCNQCRAGDGITLVMKFKGLDFPHACELVLDLVGQPKKQPEHKPVQRKSCADQEIASPTPRVNKLLKEACQIEDCEPARRYMQARGLWPLPPMHKLRAHPSLDYWQEGKRVGHYPALIAAVRDVNGQIVTAHVTYLEQHGAKIKIYEPRKILSGMQGRAGCAVRLMRLDGETLGIGEGIETCFSAAAIHAVPVWAALNTSLLAKFDPPPEVKRLVIFADRDIAGMDAAGKLMQRLQGRVQFELAIPQCKDWNDALMERA